MEMQVFDIRGQYLTGVWVQRAPGTTGGSGGIILEGRIAERSPGIHDTGLALAPDIQVLGMIQGQRMPILMSGCRRMIGQVTQLEITGIGSQPVRERNIMQG